MEVEYASWLVLSGTVYQMIGIGPESRRPLVTALANSLRPLTPAEHDSITQPRLRVVSAEPGEWLPQLSKRAGNVLPLPVLAATNGLAEGAHFKGGKLVKVGVRRPYKARQ